MKRKITFFAYLFILGAMMLSVILACKKEQPSPDSKNQYDLSAVKRYLAQLSLHEIATGLADNIDFSSVKIVGNLYVFSGHKPISQLKNQLRSMYSIHMGIKLREELSTHSMKTPAKPSW